MVATKLSSSYDSGHEVSQPADGAVKILTMLDSLSPEQSGGFFAYDRQPIA
jgi:hypothetical protein